MRSARAGGMLLFPRKLLKITFLQYLDGSENDGESELLSVPPEEEPMTELPPEEAETEQNEAARKTAAEKKASKKTVKKETEGTPSGAPPANNNEEREDENWGISQPELGF